MDAPDQDQAFAAMMGVIPPIQDVEWIPLAGARDRVLAHAVRARDGGEDLLQAGERIDTGAVALLGSLGMFEVDVVRAPRAALAFDPSPSGIVAEAVAAGLATACGARAATSPMPEAGTDALAAHLRRLARNHDAILTRNDAASAEIVREMGRLDVPPSPRWAQFWAGRIGSCLVFGLPNSPGAIVLSYALWLAPALWKLEGRPDAPTAWTSAISRSEVGDESCSSYLLARLATNEGVTTVEECFDPFAVQAADLRRVNAVVRREGSIVAGASVSVTSMSWAFTRAL